MVSGVPDTENTGEVQQRASAREGGRRAQGTCCNRDDFLQEERTLLRGGRHVAQACEHNDAIACHLDEVGARGASSGASTWRPSLSGPVTFFFVRLGRQRQREGWGPVGDSMAMVRFPTAQLSSVMDHTAER